ncbi:hypothetical protein THAOC_24941 [Thalassiosira oceanica]|uniref:Secreted protein n=1 Tax=Thalassiosira oceanica TaxID=159749 RepID=K0RQI0_THAOC|nr:hypothetical protein THAOC_24941 [Thalassiosira oceanica]|eukprot:EJK55335.1 hypothetical protein THAOC_24941 [Thalassiosira oceanica]
MMSLSLTALCPTALAVEARGGRVEGDYTYHRGTDILICAMFIPPRFLRWNPGRDGPDSQVIGGGASFLFSLTWTLGGNNSVSRRRRRRRRRRHRRSCRIIAESA